MMHKENSPPPSADDFENMDDEDIEFDEDDVVEEVIEMTPEECIEMLSDENAPEKDDAVCVFTKHSKSVFCGSLSKDAKLATTGGEDDKAFVWDTSSGQLLLECKNNESVIFAKFNHNDTLVAIANMDGSVQVWDLKSKTQIWSNLIGEITWLHWHMSANVLFATSAEGEIYMWKIPDGSCKSLQSLQQRVETALLLPDGKRLAVGYESGTMRILDLKTCTVVHTISSENGHTNVITSMDCHPNNNLIVSAATDGKTILSTSQSGKVVTVLQNLLLENNDNPDQMEEDGPSNWVESVKFHNDPQKSIVASGTRSGEIFVWDITKQVLRNRLTPANFGITNLIWKGITNTLFAVGSDGTVLSCDAWTADQIRFYYGHVADVLDVCISSDGKTLLTTSDDYTARIFSVEN